MFVQRQAGNPAESLERLYLSDSQREVIATLRRGLARPNGIVAVSGDSGLGKTTLVGAVMAELGEPVRTITAGKDDALAALQDLRASTSPASTNQALGGILVVDDAHQMPAVALNRLFAALAHAQSNPVRLVLVMQSSFWSMVGTPAMAAIRDRIDTRAVLFPMSYNEAELYVEHLFGLAGAAAAAVLSREALHGLILRAKGNPQQLNVELDRVLRGKPGAPRPGAPRMPSPPEAPEPAVLADAVATNRKPRTGRVISAVLALGAVGLALWATMMPFPASAPASDIVAEREVQPVAGQTPPSAPVAPPAPSWPTLAPARPSKSPTAVAGGASGLPPFSEPALTPPDVAPWIAPEEPNLAEPAMARLAAPEEADVAEVSATQAPQNAAPAPPSPPSPARPRPARPEVARSPAAPPEEPLSAAIVALLLRRGDAMLELHDMSAARRLFERAALAGNATAAIALGATYDPLRHPGDADIDASLARRWYDMAAQRGDEEASRRLSALDSLKAPQ